MKIKSEIITGRIVFINTGYVKKYELQKTEVHMQVIWLKNREVSFYE